MQRHKFIERKRMLRKGREYILEKIFRQETVAVDELQQLETWIFEEEGSQCRIINIEFMRNFFGEHEKLFLERSKEYFGDSVIYCNMNLTEAYMILREKQQLEVQTVERKLQNLMHRAAQLNRDEVSAIVGNKVGSLSEFMKEAKRVHSVRLQTFGFNNCIVWLSQDNDKNKMAIESVEQQLLLAMDVNDRELIRKFSKLLLGIMADSKIMSRLYTQNICYTMIHAVYQRNDIDYDKIMAAVDILFKTSEMDEMVEKFDKAFDEILDTTKDNSVNQKEVVKKVKQIIANSEEENIGLTHVAKKLHMDPSYVGYLFKTSEGRTVGQYIAEQMER